MELPPRCVLLRTCQLIDLKRQLFERFKSQFLDRQKSIFQVTENDLFCSTVAPVYEWRSRLLLIPTMPSCICWRHQLSEMNGWTVVPINLIDTTANRTIESSPITLIFETVIMLYHNYNILHVINYYNNSIITILQKLNILTKNKHSYKN